MYSHQCNICIFLSIETQQMSVSLFKSQVTSWNFKCLFFFLQRMHSCSEQFHFKNRLDAIVKNISATEMDILEKTIKVFFNHKQHLESPQTFVCLIQTKGSLEILHQHGQPSYSPQPITFNLKMLSYLQDFNILTLFCFKT